MRISRAMLESMARTRGRPLAYLFLGITAWIGGRVYWTQSIADDVAAIAASPARPATIAQPAMAAAPVAQTPAINFPNFATDTAFLKPSPRNKTARRIEPALEYRHDDSRNSALPAVPRMTEVSQSLATVMTTPSTNTPAAAEQASSRAAKRRWGGEVYAYSFWRISSDSGAVLAPGAQYGGSQSGLIGTLDPFGDPDRGMTLMLRGSATPDGDEREMALGLRWKPMASWPVTLSAERRFRDNETDRFAAYLAGGVDDMPLLGKLTLNGYAQAGYATGRGGGGFFDAQARVLHPLARIGSVPLAVGAGSWAGGQRGAKRLDVGPTISAKLDTGPAVLLIQLDWRLRAAGQCRAQRRDGIDGIDRILAYFPFTARRGNMPCMKIVRKILLLGTAFALAGCSTIAPAPEDPKAIIAPTSAAIEEVSKAYVALTLEAGTHEAEYVDAYYGPAELKAAAEAKPRTKAELIVEARRLIGQLDQLPAGTSENAQRRMALRGMLVAAETRLQMLEGRKFSFNDEAKGQFATVPQLKPLSHYNTILARLEKDIPGIGPLAARVDAFNERFVIPKDRLKPVFDAAIAECRRRTTAHMQLPAGESFVMEFVTGKPWSGYNYYQGNYKSLIQINTDLPIRISRAVDLGCHEGYPGHHVLNLMIESKLARGENGGRGWKEFEVNPLYSPQSVISEGSANYGIDLAFSPDERLKFERDVLYPLAGLDPKTAEAFWCPARG
jgi:hypothetical protein